MTCSRYSRPIIAFWFGVGVGISGYCLGGQGRYNTPRTLDDWALVDIEELLREQLGYPVWVENDGNAAAIGESLVGAGRTYDNFAYIFFSTGIITLKILSFIPKESMR